MGCTHQLVPDDSDLVFWESLMNDAGDKQSYDIFERWLRKVLSLPKRPIWGAINTGQAADRYGDNCHNKPYCPIAEGVNMYWWKEVWPAYKDESDMMFMSGRRGCYALADTIPECTGLTVTWHPSPNGHRLMAETFAYWFLKIALEGLQKHQPAIEFMVRGSEGRPTAELECLLEDPLGKRVDADTTLPHREPKYCGDQCKDAPNWCISSYIPTPKHLQIGNFVT